MNNLWFHFFMRGFMIAIAIAVITSYPECLRFFAIMTISYGAWYVSVTVGQIIRGYRRSRRQRISKLMKKAHSINETAQ